MLKSMAWTGQLILMDPCWFEREPPAMGKTREVRGAYNMLKHKNNFFNWRQNDDCVGRKNRCPRFVSLNSTERKDIHPAQ